MRIRNLQVNHLTDPVGIDGKNIRLTWTLEGGKQQSAFQVKTTSGSDSGKTAGSAMAYRLPEALPYGTKSVISLVVWDENDQPSEEVSVSVINGMDMSLWTAKWINPELTTPETDHRPASYLRKTFTIKEVPAEAYVYATCHGIMNIAINGKEICDHQLMPGTQQYNKRLMAETVEVSSFLQQGENEILVSLGDGWYRGSMANNQVKNVYGTDLALLLQLQAEGETVLTTDETWEASQNGPIGRNDFMKGEEYDARKEKISDADFHEVKVEDFGYDNLIYADTVPVRPRETFTAKYINVPNGEKVLDFGQNLVGYTCIDLVGEEGKAIKLSHGETLDENGNFTTANFQNPRLPMTQDIVYTCKNGRNVYHPTKTYMGFRYVKVEADFDVKETDITAKAIYSDIRQTAEFSCGNEEVNQLFKNAIWSMKGNFVDVPTDCPTREKSGYSGDCQAFVHTAMYLMDCYPVYAKWIREQAAGQYEDGVVPQIAPKANPAGEKEKLVGMFDMDGGIGWSDSFEIVPYRLMKRYKDSSLIEENYEAIKRWTEHEISRAKRTREVNKAVLPEEYREYMIDEDFMWGEWMEPGQTDAYLRDILMKGDVEVGTAFFYMNLRYVQQMAELLGKTEDAARYGELAEKAKEAYRAVFLKDGHITEEKRQCRYVRPIAHDLLTEEEKRICAADLAALIEANGDHLNTGFLTTHELCRSLSDNGQKKKAFDLLLQREMPGWLYAVTRGCTTIPERWDIYDENGAPKDSFNHYSYGAIAGWLIDSVCGIRAEDGSITISPVTDERLGFASGTYDSPFGKIVSSWKYENGSVSYHFEIPVNMQAEIILENGIREVVNAGIYEY